ncbi:hypothetical protein N0V93_007285 [Gnomoniopsis smithogilvyi]|uniref:Uncharacterized protein n=1 Tax=Gnomoniopsis smithogilvyi TaxID=1191159 RepID=A0A9W8YPS7_9PEZI|nr:hypothetical protein N0V93_007285 [Gnomoniopsis smithogilvyi]
MRCITGQYTTATHSVRSVLHKPQDLRFDRDKKARLSVTQIRPQSRPSVQTCSHVKSSQSQKTRSTTPPNTLFKSSSFCLPTGRYELSPIPSL